MRSCCRERPPGRGVVSSRLSGPVLAAWQAALAAEQRAAFGYALLGPRLPSADRALGHGCQAEHEQLRDASADAIAAAGTPPAAPRGDYPELYPAARSPRTLAARLEDDCAAAWRYLYEQAASGSGAVPVRVQAQRALSASAARATRWRVRAHSRRPVVAFPGTG